MTNKLKLLLWHWQGVILTIYIMTASLHNCIIKKDKVPHFKEAKKPKHSQISGRI